MFPLAETSNTVNFFFHLSSFVLSVTERKEIEFLVREYILQFHIDDLSN